MEKSVEIVLLGESGSGKTTFMNTCYLIQLNESLEKVNHVYVKTEFKEGKFQEGNPEDQSKSQTVEPRVTNFKLSFPGINYNVKLIDTPGFADVDMSKDSKHLDSIRNKLLDAEPNGFLVLTNGSQCRVNTQKKYVENMIDQILGAGFKKNVLYLQTNCKKLNTEQMKHFESTEENTFCYDNFMFAVDWNDAEYQKKAAKLFDQLKPVVQKILDKFSQMKCETRKLKSITSSINHFRTLLSDIIDMYEILEKKEHEIAEIKNEIAHEIKKTKPIESSNTLSEFNKEQESLELNKEKELQATESEKNELHNKLNESWKKLHDIIIDIKTANCSINIYDVFDAATKKRSSKRDFEWKEMLSNNENCLHQKNKVSASIQICKKIGQMFTRVLNEAISNHKISHNQVGTEQDERKEEKQIEIISAKNNELSGLIIIDENDLNDNKILEQTEEDKAILKGVKILEPAIIDKVYLRNNNLPRAKKIDEVSITKSEESEFELMDDDKLSELESIDEIYINEYKMLEQAKEGNAFLKKVEIFEPINIDKAFSKNNDILESTIVGKDCQEDNEMPEFPNIGQTLTEQNEISESTKVGEICSENNYVAESARPDKTSPENNDLSQEINANATCPKIHEVSDSTVVGKNCQEDHDMPEFPNTDQTLTEQNEISESTKLGEICSEDNYVAESVRPDKDSPENNDLSQEIKVNATCPQNHEVQQPAINDENCQENHDMSEFPNIGQTLTEQNEISKSTKVGEIFSENNYVAESARPDKTSSENNDLSQEINANATCPKIHEVSESKVVGKDCQENHDVSGLLAVDKSSTEQNEISESTKVGEIFSENNYGPESARPDKDSSENNDLSQEIKADATCPKNHEVSESTVVWKDCQENRDVLGLLAVDKSSTEQNEISESTKVGEICSNNNYVPESARPDKDSSENNDLLEEIKNNVTCPQNHKVSESTVVSNPCQESYELPKLRKVNGSPIIDGEELSSTKGDKILVKKYKNIISEITMETQSEKNERLEFEQNKNPQFPATKEIQPTGMVSGIWVSNKSISSNTKSFRSPKMNTVIRMIFIVLLLILLALVTFVGFKHTNIFVSLVSHTQCEISCNAFYSQQLNLISNF